jgi:hypothetical protein
VLLLAGTWSVWRAATGEEPLGATGIVLVVSGLVLVTRAGRAVVAWIGEGVITGVCLIAGVAFSAVGALMLLPYAQVLTAGGRIPVGSVVIPLLFFGCGLVLLVRGVRRLWRLRGLPKWRG